MGKTRRSKVYDFAHQAGASLERHYLDPVRTIAQTRNDILVRKVIREQYLHPVRAAYGEKAARLVKASFLDAQRRAGKRAKAARRRNR